MPRSGRGCANLRHAIEQSTRETLFTTIRTARLERCGGMYIILMVSQFRPLDMKQPTVSVGRDLPSRMFGRRRFSRIDDVSFRKSVGIGR